MKEHRQRAPAYPREDSTSGQASAAKDEDDVLIRRMAQGDESALAALYDRWGERLHTVAFWILRDGDEAEDVVEETLWQVWRTANQYDVRRAPCSTWIMMIARCRALDRLRVQRRRAGYVVAHPTISGLFDGPVSDVGDLSGARSNGMERHSELVEALAALPPEQRKVVEMAFFGGLSHAEIATQTALPLGTVKTRIRLALQKLRQRIKFRGDETP